MLTQELEAETQQDVDWAIRAGIWGPNDLWGRVQTYRPAE